MQEPTESEETRTDIKEISNDGIFIHVSSGPEAPNKVLMGLSLAAKMASADKDVAVFFDLEGIKVILKDSPELSGEHYLSSRESLDKLKDAGAILMACPMCLKKHGKTENDLMEGFIIAEIEKFFNFTDGRIISLDY